MVIPGICLAVKLHWESHALMVGVGPVSGYSACIRSLRLSRVFQDGPEKDRSTKWCSCFFLGGPADLVSWLEAAYMSCKRRVRGRRFLRLVEGSYCGMDLIAGFECLSI
ncbi:hypothetical protein AVEN_204800-1 [Araneus ventricosus]|uniref:Uncharacterized protein n=1 Tax=Araneus ventricosus TaxID=182803 RepID=A0A4Y2HI08_ARAVE|nr:hypothetical protein AVEN_204800-1 [Araneus ventricosus]